jgi:hypothetical protein
MRNQMDTEAETEGLYIGLTDLPLADVSVDLGSGIVLRGTEATFMSPLVMVNTSEQSMKVDKTKPLVNGLPPLPQPAYLQIGGKRTKVTAELYVPTSAAATHRERFAMARTLVFLLRLWTNPAIGMHAMADQSFSTLFEADKKQIVPLETWPRHVQLALINEKSVDSSSEWVRKNWREAHRLYMSSTEFRLAADALDTGQFVLNEALVLVSLWGALEALFSPSTSELKFRVSALIASYLETPGTARAALQKQVASLYDKRSAAAHGKPRHESPDVLASFELLRKVLIRMITNKSVPSKEMLEARLFGAE